MSRASLYDALDRVITTTNGAGQTLGYRYDAGSHLTRLLYPDKTVITRTYDVLDRLSGVTDWQGHTSAFGYDRDSNPITATLPTTHGVINVRSLPDSFAQDQTRKAEAGHDPARTCLSRRWLSRDP